MVPLGIILPARYTQSIGALMCMSFLFSMWRMNKKVELKNEGRKMKQQALTRDEISAAILKPTAFKTDKEKKIEDREWRILISGLH
jgi:hypothetical protein